MARSFPPVTATLVAIRLESWAYAERKPGRVPPADSPNRPALARLWQVAELAASKRRGRRTFQHAGWKFSISYLNEQLWVIDWYTQRILVRAPTSRPALNEVLGLHVGGI